MNIQHGTPFDCYHGDINDINKLLPLLETVSSYQDTSQPVGVVVETVVLLWVTLIPLPSTHVILILREIATEDEHLLLFYIVTAITFLPSYPDHWIDLRQM